MSSLGTTDPVALLAMALRVSESGMAPTEENTRDGRDLAARLSELPPDILRQGVGAVLMGEHLDHALDWLQVTGALRILLPELEATVGFSQEGGRRHKDVWAHTKMVVKQCPPDPIVRWSGLLHDVGKVRTRRFEADGSVTFYGHAEVGARMFDKVQPRFRFPDEERARIRFLVLMHLRANAYQDGWTNAAVRRFDKEMGVFLDDLLHLSAADVTSRRPGRREEAAGNLERMRGRILDLRELDAKQPPLPPGLGNEIMTAFNLPPSRRVGQLRALCEQAVEDGRLEERREIGYYMDFLRAAEAGEAASPVTADPCK